MRPEINGLSGGGGDFSEVKWGKKLLVVDLTTDRPRRGIVFGKATIAGVPLNDQKHNGPLFLTSNLFLAKKM